MTLRIFCIIGLVCIFGNDVFSMGTEDDLNGSVGGRYKDVYLAPLLKRNPGQDTIAAELMPTFRMEQSSFVITSVNVDGRPAHLKKNNWELPYWGTIKGDKLNQRIMALLFGKSSGSVGSLSFEIQSGDLTTTSKIEQVGYFLTEASSCLKELFERQNPSVLTFKVKASFLFRDYEHDLDVYLSANFKKKPVPELHYGWVYALNPDTNQIDVFRKTLYPSLLGKQYVQIVSVPSKESDAFLGGDYEMVDEEQDGEEGGTTADAGGLAASASVPSIKDLLSGEETPKSAFDVRKIQRIIPFEEGVSFLGAQVLSDDVVREENNEFWNTYQGLRENLFLDPKGSEEIRQILTFCSMKIDRGVSLIRRKDNTWLKSDLRLVQETTTQYFPNKQWLDRWKPEEDEDQPLFNSFLEHCCERLKSPPAYSFASQEKSERWVPNFGEDVPPPGYYRVREGVWISCGDSQIRDASPHPDEKSYRVRMMRDLFLLKSEQKSSDKEESDTRKSEWRELLLRKPQNIRSLRMDVDPSDGEEMGILFEALEASSALSSVTLKLGPVTERDLEAILDILRRKESLRDFCCVGPFSTKYEGNVIVRMKDFITNHPSLDEVIIFDGRGIPIRISKERGREVHVSDFHKNITITPSTLPFLQTLESYKKNGLFQEVSGITFKGFSSEDYEGIRPFLDRCQDANFSLSFVNCFGEQGISIRLLKRDFSRFHALSFTGVRIASFLEGNSIGGIFFLALKSLTLNNCSDLEAGGISTFLSQMGRIQHLNLEETKLPPTIDMENYFGELTHLNLRGCFTDEQVSVDILRRLFAPTKLIELDFSFNPLPSNIRPEDFSGSFQSLNLSGCFKERIPSPLLLHFLEYSHLLDLRTNPYPKGFVSPQKNKPKHIFGHQELMRQIEALGNNPSLFIGYEGDHLEYQNFPHQSISRIPGKVMSSFTACFFGVQGTPESQVTEYLQGVFASASCSSGREGTTMKQEVVFHQDSWLLWEKERLVQIFSGLVNRVQKVTFSGSWKEAQGIDALLNLISLSSSIQEVNFEDLLKSVFQTGLETPISWLLGKNTLKTVCFKGYRGEEIRCLKADKSFGEGSEDSDDDSDDVYPCAVSPSDIEEGELSQHLKSLTETAQGIEFRRSQLQENFKVKDIISVIQEVLGQNTSLAAMKFSDCLRGADDIRSVMAQLNSYPQIVEISFIGGERNPIPIPPEFIREIEELFSSSHLRRLTFKNSGQKKKETYEKTHGAFSVEYPRKETMVFEAPFSKFGNPLLGESLKLYESLYHITFKGSAADAILQGERQTLRNILKELSSLKRPFSLTLNDFFKGMHPENILRFFQKLKILPVETLDISGTIFTHEEYAALSVLFNKEFITLRELSLNLPHRRHYPVSRGFKAMAATGAVAAAAATVTVLTGGFALIPVAAGAIGVTAAGGAAGAASGFVRDGLKKKKPSQQVVEALGALTRSGLNINVYGVKKSQEGLKATLKAFMAVRGDGKGPKFNLLSQISKDAEAEEVQSDPENEPEDA